MMESSNIPSTGQQSTYGRVVSNCIALPAITAHCSQYRINTTIITAHQRLEHLCVIACLYNSQQKRHNLQGILHISNQPSHH